MKNWLFKHFQAMYESGDEDAIFINDFEESLIERVQESAEFTSPPTWRPGHD